MRFRTLRFASSGNSGSTGSSRRSFASSTRIIAAVPVIGLVIEAMRKIVSRRIGSLPPKAFAPIASTCVSPRRLTSVTRPDMRPLSTWRAMASRMRPRRALDNPPLPEGGLAAVCGDCASTTVGAANAAEAATDFRNDRRSVLTKPPSPGTLRGVPESDACPRLPRNSRPRSRAPWRTGTPSAYRGASCRLRP
jgi:hypothetical protein